MVKAKAEITISLIIDISSITRYYLLQSSTSSAPTRPSTYPPSSSWKITEPAYTTGSTNTLYFVDCTVFTNGEFKYSAVSVSSAYEAAKIAYNKAVNTESRITLAETKIDQNKADILLRATKTEFNALVEGNLIVNGFGLNRNNYNFSSWVYDGADNCEGFPAFSFTGTPRELYIPQYAIPIDPTKTYEFRMFFKGTGNKMYLGWDEFDIDGKQISATYSMGYPNSTTTLARELKNGDTTVYLTNASGWTNSTATHQLGLIFWNYKDSTGYQYPVGVYSRNAWTNLYVSSNVNKTSNTITLNTAWNHGTFPAGTKVSQSNSAGHKYFNYSNVAPPSLWTETSYTIGGNQPLYSFNSNKINQATKYMRFLILHNYGGGTTSSTTKISKISLTDVTLKQTLSNNYYTKTQTDAKIKVESDKITSAVSRITDAENSLSTLEQTASGLSLTLTSVKNDLSANYTKKTLPDTRNTNQSPEWYVSNYPRQSITEFKMASSIGLSGETYAVLETIVPWNNTSGGYPKQTAKVGNKEYWRVGTSNTAWGPWQDSLGKATDAAKTATNYLSFSTSGLVVGDMTKSTLGKNVLIDSDSVDIRNGSSVLASFGANTVILGQNAENSTIDLCNGAGTIKAATSGTSTSYPKYDSILIESEKINFGCTTFDCKTSKKGSDGYLYESSHESLSSTVGFSGLNSTVTAPVNSSNTIYINECGVSASAAKELNQTRSWLFAKQDKTVGSTTSTVKSNQFNVYADYSETAKPILIGSGRTEFTGENKTLWSGAIYMQSGQTATLSEAVTDQANGIVLVFSLYDGGAKNQEFYTHYIPKSFCSLQNLKGMSIPIHSPWGNAVKYLYIGNTVINGHENNNLEMKTVGGITYNNRRFVMRYVIGV